MTSTSADPVARAGLIAELARDRLVAVIRADHGFDAVGLAETMLAGSVRFLEITLTTPGAIASIASLQEHRGHGLRLGAGTVLDAAAAIDAIHAGVDYLVSPTLEHDVVRVAHDAGRAACIGALTPTEVLTAWRAGADVVKVFPGRVATPGYFADLAGPLPGIRLMPTGNVDPETAAAYLKAGAIAVGVGKSLVDPALLRDGAFDAIGADVRRWRTLIDAVPHAGR